MFILLVLWQVRPLSADQFQSALPSYQYAFPRDHGPHLAYATEWWYYTGQLRDPRGRLFGYQLTWFRFALAPKVTRASRWAARDVYFAHFALTDVRNGRFLYTDAIQRGALGLAGSASGAGGKDPKAWVGDWLLQFTGKTGDRQTLHASGKSDAEGSKDVPFALDLTQLALKSPVIQGKDGISRKSAGATHASHYYSYTRLKTAGSLTLGGERFSLSGESWFDHEFGSGQMADGQTGWDWFSLQLNDGRELMLYRLRLKNGGTEPFSSGTLVNRDGSSRYLALKEFQVEPVTYWTASGGIRYPAKWRIAVPSEGLTLETTPLVADQELRPKRSLGGGVGYWEGAVSIAGQARGQAIMGQGYVEMTGYREGMAGVF